MFTFFKTVAVIACMTLIVPLAVWGGTGSLRSAWWALKRYLIVMGILVGIGAGFSVISILTHL